MPRKKKILAILPSDEFYGKERANFEVYKLLKEQNNVSLFIIINKNADKRIRIHSQNYQSYSFSFPDRKPRKLRYLKYLITLTSSNIRLLFLLLKLRPDYLFLNTEMSFYDYFLPFYFSKAKIVFRIGDAPAFTKLSNYKYNSWVWEKLVCKKVDSIICVSNYILKKIKESGRHSESDHVIYSYPPYRNKEKKAINLSIQKNKFNFGYIGQIFEDKGVDLMLKAAISLLKIRKDVSFHFAGSLNYKPEFSRKLKESYENSTDKNKIHFLGEIDDVQSFYSNMDVICIPSVKEEPLANVLIEAKHFGKACIIFKSGGLPELVKHLHDGFICDTKSTKSLEQAFYYYLKNPSLIKKHGSNSLKSVEHLGITYSTFKQKWLSVFELYDN